MVLRVGWAGRHALTALQGASLRERHGEATKGVKMGNIDGRKGVTWSRSYCVWLWGETVLLRSMCVDCSLDGLWYSRKSRLLHEIKERLYKGSPMWYRSIIIECSYVGTYEHSHDLRTLSEINSMWSNVDPTTKK